MRIRYWLLLALAAILVLLVGVGCGNNAKATQLEKENKLLREVAGPPPASLDQYYPPQAPGPIFLGEIFTLSGALEGIGSDLQERDIPGAKANYDPFKAQYTKVSGMVPEWKDRFPPAPAKFFPQQFYLPGF